MVQRISQRTWLQSWSWYNQVVWDNQILTSLVLVPALWHAYEFSSFFFFFFPFFIYFGKYMCGCEESGVILGRSGALVEGIIHHTKWPLSWLLVMIICLVLFSFNEFFINEALWCWKCMSPFPELTTQFAVSHELPVCHTPRFCLNAEILFILSVFAILMTVCFKWACFFFLSKLFLFFFVFVYLLFVSVENTRTVSKNLGCKTKCDDNTCADQVDVLIPEVIQVLYASFV